MNPNWLLTHYVVQASLELETPPCFDLPSAGITSVHQHTCLENRTFYNLFNVLWCFAMRVVPLELGLQF